MAINQYEDKLKNVYDKHYCSGECVNYPQCKKGLIDDGVLFNCAKLGKHYGDEPYRKVLVTTTIYVCTKMPIQKRII